MNNREYTIWALGFVVSLFFWVILLFIDRSACLSALGGAVISMIGTKIFENRSEVYKYRTIYIAGAFTASLANFAIGTNWFLSFFYGFIMAEAPVFILMLFEDYTGKK